MLDINVNGSKRFQLTEKGKFWEINGHPARIVLVSVSGNEHHLLVNDKPVTVFLSEWNKAEKKATLIVNGKKVTTEVTTELDLLLKQMGFENAGKLKASEIKAPMPGLIHSLKVKEGDLVKKGDPLIILEAMKMENVLKSPTDGKIKKVHVKEKTTVDKGTLMLSFE